MIRREYIVGSGATFPFRITSGGTYQDLVAYTIEFNGRTDTRNLAYTLVYDVVNPTVINVPYSALITDGVDHVARGTFDITVVATGVLERSEEYLLTARV